LKHFFYVYHYRVPWWSEFVSSHVGLHYTHIFSFLKRNLQMYRLVFQLDLLRCLFHFNFFCNLFSIYLTIDIFFNFLTYLFPFTYRPFPKKHAFQWNLCCLNVSWKDKTIWYIHKDRSHRNYNQCFVFHVFVLKIILILHI